jgi:glutamate dehydrogenase/leucine dehydrogenase
MSTSAAPTWGALSPEAFCDQLRAFELQRAALWTDSQGDLRVSDARLAPLAALVRENTRDFAGHAALFFERGAQSGALLGAFLHRVDRGQGAGGVRLWNYSTLSDFVNDGLRLSRGMGRKNALAGLWWGGGKGVIARPAALGAADRVRLFEDYGRFVSSLRGVYVTAEDVGTTPEDMAVIFKQTRFTTCVPPAVGGSGNPSYATAVGVVCAMEAALEGIGHGPLLGKTIAIQGLGNVGLNIARLVLERLAVRVVAVDISPENIARARAEVTDRRLEVRLVAAGDDSILEQPCDVLAPCALGGVLSPSSIARLRARIVCGAANNQLLDEDRDAELLRQRGILLVPDFLANRMGIVNCANEQYGSWPDTEDPAVTRHYDREWSGSIFQVAQAVIRHAGLHGTTTARAAAILADERALEPHPIFPGRTKALVNGVISGGWAAATASTMSATPVPRGA